MTREEAIERLKHTDACDSDLCEALDIAIKALEQQSEDKKQRYCDDCLHRNVCGLEGANEESMTYCADKMEVE